MAFNDTASNWLWTYGTHLDEVLNKTLQWPFPNCSMEIMQVVNDVFTMPVRPNMRLYGGIISAAGIILSALSICVVWRKTFKEKNSFFTTMLIIASLDFLFCLGSLFLRILRDTFDMEGSKNYLAMSLINYLRGLTLSISLASDLCVLALTIERYFAISKPESYHNLSKKKKKIARILTSVIIILLASTRIHYSLTTTVVQVDDSYHYVISALSFKKFIQALVTFSDIILPFLLLLSILLVSILFLIVIIKRNKPQSKVYPGHLSHYDDPQISNVITLTLALDFLFIANQSGYCAYAIFELWYTQLSITFQSDYEELINWCAVVRYAYLTGFASLILECLSHAINFFLYITFSKGFRSEFFALFRKNL